MDKITILIVDAHKLVSNGIAFMLKLRNEFAVLGEACCGEEALNLVKDFKPDIVLAEYKIATGNDYEFTFAVRKFSPGSKVIWLSGHAMVAYPRKMAAAGCFGFLTKNSSQDELFTALVEVAKGNKFICEEVKTKLTDNFLGLNEQAGRFDHLTLRELDVIFCVRSGLSSKEIAEKYSLSLKTVEVHRHNILKKLKLKNTAALVNLMNENGF